MNRFLWILKTAVFSLILGFPLLTKLAFAEDSTPLSELQRDLSALLREYGERAGLSVRLPSGELLFSSNGQKSFVPASVAKLISSACALEQLGPDFQLKTQFLHRGVLEDGVLKGDFVVRGGGDFSFVIEDLKIVLERLIHVHGIRKIEGNLVFDTSLFREPRMRIYDDFDRDVGRAFNALLTPAPINHNAFSLWVRPEGRRAVAEIFPHAAINIEVNNQLRVGSGRLGGSQTRLNYLPQYDRLEISGRIGQQDSPRAYYLSVKDPYESFGRLFKYNYRILGGEWNGSVQIESLSRAADVELFSHESRAISRLLFDINKLSTNFGSEMLNLQAAHHRLKTPVSVEDGQNFLKACMTQFGYTENQIHLMNASGLARSTRIQPDALSRLLVQILEKDYSPEFLSSLSVLGRDGTTARRSGLPVAQARLKTGTIRSVYSIAGYVGADYRNLYSMVMVLNCDSCNRREWEAKENRVIERLLRHQRSTP